MKLAKTSGKMSFEQPQTTLPPLKSLRTAQRVRVRSSRSTLRRAPWQQHSPLSMGHKDEVKNSMWLPSDKADIRALRERWGSSCRTIIHGVLARTLIAYIVDAGSLLRHQVSDPRHRLSAVVTLRYIVLRQAPRCRRILSILWCLLQISWHPKSPECRVGACQHQRYWAI